MDSVVPDLERYDPWACGGMPLLNVSHVWPATRTLGPGLRAVVWVQGCPLRCPGCIAPEWIPMTINQLVTPARLAERLARDPDVSGLTISGGEPMLQALGLADLARLMRTRREFSIICFTGFTLERLRSHPPGPGIGEFLAEIDVLIDGPYIAERNDNRGLRGSSNQRIHRLSTRIGDTVALETQPRSVELVVGSSAAMLIGVPPDGVLDALRSAAGPPSQPETSPAGDRDNEHESRGGAP